MQCDFHIIYNQTNLYNLDYWGTKHLFILFLMACSTVPVTRWFQLIYITNNFIFINSLPCFFLYPSDPVEWQHDRLIKNRESVQYYFLLITLTCYLISNRKYPEVSSIKATIAGCSGKHRSEPNKV